MDPFELLARRTADKSDLRVEQATVTAVSGKTATVQMRGGSVAGVEFIGGAPPAVGKRVWLLIDQGRIVGLSSGGAGSLDLAAADARWVNVTGDAMTGALAMGNNKITGLGTATLSTDALSRSAGDARYVMNTGDTMTGNLTVDVASGAQLNVKSASLRGLIFPEESNATTFISSFGRNDSLPKKMEFQGAPFKFTYGDVEISQNLTAVGGIQVGVNRVAANRQTVTDHIDLYGAVIGISVTANSLNFVNGGTSGHWFVKDTGALHIVHASAYQTSLAAFAAESPLPMAVQPRSQSTADEPMVDTTALLAVMYDALMSLPGGAAALQTAASRIRKGVT